MQFDPKDDLCPCVYLLYNSKVKISILENWISYNSIQIIRIINFIQFK